MRATRAAFGASLAFLRIAPGAIRRELCARAQVWAAIRDARHRAMGLHRRKRGHA